MRTLAVAAASLVALAAAEAVWDPSAVIATARAAGAKWEAAALAAVSGRRLAHELEGYTYEQWLSEMGHRHPGTREAWSYNMDRIRTHNANPHRTWTAGVNHFTGLTPAEFKSSVVNGHNMRMAQERRAQPGRLQGRPGAQYQAVSDLPTTVDWRTKGVVTAVKDQGGCGGCWSFSAAETGESAVAIASGKLMVFSEQALIDCTPNPDQCGGTGGCNGATQELAFNWTMSAGFTLESSYPYQGVTGTCDMSKVIPVAAITGYVELPPNNYTTLMNEVALNGPVAISAAAEPWQIYESGVFNTPCGADVDHAIVLVGYGHDATSNLDYYLIRNSWSSGWGEDGYIRLVRYGNSAKGEPCFTDHTPGDGDGCKGGPSSITVCGWCGVLSDSSTVLGAHAV